MAVAASVVAVAAVAVALVVVAPAAAAHLLAILRRGIPSCLPVAAIRLLDLRLCPILRPVAVVLTPAVAALLAVALMVAPVAEVALAASRLRLS